MKFTLLGTGTSQGIPVMGCDCEVCVSIDPRDTRLRASAMVQEGEKTIVIDCGPDFRQQMLAHHVKQVDAVVLTHDHQDHVAGLDELRSYIFKQGRPMPIYAEQNVIEALKERFSYAFRENPYPGAPQFEMIPITPGPLTIDIFELEAIRVMHGKLPILAFRIKSLAYITDVNAIPDESKDTLANLDTLVLDALHHRPHHSHYNLEEAIEVVNQLKPKQSYFTHISHQMGLHDNVNAGLPGHMELAFDGLSIVS